MSVTKAIATRYVATGRAFRLRRVAHRHRRLTRSIQHLGHISQYRKADVGCILLTAPFLSHAFPRARDCVRRTPLRSIKHHVKTILEHVPDGGLPESAVVIIYILQNDDILTRSINELGQTLQ